MFIGREKELLILNSHYIKDEFQMTVIYGRRRVGKSTLIKEFINNKKCVYFSAIKGNLERNVKLLGSSVIKNLFTEKASVAFDSLFDIFDYIGEYSKENKLIFVIDELPYLSDAETNIVSILQHYIDNVWNECNLLLILCGSSISFMENEVLSEKSPIFGRRNSQINVKPFNYLEAAEFMPGYSIEEKAICYGITGGIAKYLSLIDVSKSLDENIVDLFFRNTGYLYEEPNNLLVQEFRNVAVYNDIINTIASGSNKINEIADNLHIETSSVSMSLKNLIGTNIVERNKAITDENNRKKVLYTLSDGMFKFWYRFIPSALASIELDMGENYYKQIVKPVINEYMGHIFEKMCQEYTLRMGLLGQFNINVNSVGSWWGTNPLNKEETDIDVVALDTVNKKCLLGECKFTNTPIDINILNRLQDRIGLIDKKYNTEGYILFSKQGYTKGVLEAPGNIYKITLDDMYKTNL